MDRRLNRELLRKQIEELGLVEVHIKTDISISTLQKWSAGNYKSKITKRSMKKTCSGLRISIDVLFPAVGADEKKAS